MVPFVQHSGEWLERQVGRSELVETHTRLGDYFLPYAIALVVGAAAIAAGWRSAVRRNKRQTLAALTVPQPSGPPFGWWLAWP
jgi:hypothetical protein